MNKKKGLLPIVLFLLTPLLVFPSIQLGQTQSITSSGIKTAKILDGASGNIKTFSLSFKEPSLGQTGQYNSFIIEGCSFTDKYGYQIPEKVISFDLPKGASVSSVKITNGRWQEIKGEYSLPPSPLRGEGTGEGETLPGTFIDAGYAPMAGKTIVSISVYPVQYNPETKKALFLKEADIEVSYGIETPAVPQVFTTLSSSGSDYSALNFEDYDSECIIITPVKYLPYAKRLRTLHQKNNNPLGPRILTRIITTDGPVSDPELGTIDGIASQPYGDTAQPPLASLPTSLCPEGDFTTRTDATIYPNRNTRIAPRFNSRLAQKILSFLLDCHDAPGYLGPASGQVGYYRMHKLQYIVILGNANEVPVSNYVYSTAASGTQYGTDSYEYWIPTDFFYSACSRQGLISLNPYCGTGRIPVSRAEAEEIFTNLAITVISTASRTITFQLPDTQDPTDIEAGMTVVIRTGEANGRWLDIQSISYTGPSGGYYTVTLTLRANRNSGEAWLTDPAVAVGDRIDIIDTRDQMDDIITKLENWVNNRTGDSGDDWFRSVSFAGGTYKAAFTKSETSSASFYMASLSSLFWDELSCVEAINKIDDTASGGDGHSYVAGLDVRKYFASDIKADGSTYDEAFIVNDIAGIFQNSASHRAGILYFAGDNNYGLFGDLDRLHMENGYLYSSNILGYSSSTYNIFTIAHTHSTGAFDEELWFGATTGNISIGKASLLSPAGAFAYFGPIRSSLHYLNFTRAEDGLLQFSQTLSNELTMNILKRYHRSSGGNVKLNDIVSGALGDYFAKNGGSNIYHFRTLIEYHLLGSPCIYIPPPPSSFDEWTDLPATQPLNYTRTNSDNIRCYEIADNSSQTISFSYTAKSPVEVKLVDARYYTADDKQTLGAAGTYTTGISFDDVDTGKTDTTNGPGLYFVRVSQQEKGKSFYSKEQRYYFETVNKFTPSGDILVIDDDQPRRYTANSNSPDFAESVWQSAYPDYEVNYYTPELTALGKSYKVWHVENKSGTGNVGGQGRHGEVTQQVLDAYKGAGKAVVWFTGNDWFSTILPKEMIALTNFFQSGGRLFLTGQDIGWNIRTTPFYQNVLRASFVQDDIRLFNIDGIVIDDLSGGLQDIIITGGTGAGNQRWPSEIDPQSGASSCLLYDPYGAGGGARQSSGSAGIKYYNSQTGQAHVYFSFGFEAINNFGATANGRKVVMQKVLDWLGSPTSTGLFSATAGDGEVYLSWTNPNSASYPGVLILRREGAYPTTDPTNGTSYTAGQTIGNGTVIYSQSPAGTSYTDTGLTNGTTYYYIAYVFNATYQYSRLGEDYATPTTGGGPGVIPAPTNLMATAKFDEGTGKWSIDLSWIDNSTDENGFEISRRVGAGGTWVDNYATVGANVTTYTDDEGGTGLTPDTIYYYRVRAYKGSPPSEYSNWSNTASAATSPITKPTNLRAVGGVREVWLTWTNNSPGADGFEIWRSHPNPELPSHNWLLVGYAGSGAVSYRDSLTARPNIPDGRPYYYKIRPYKTGVTPEETWWSDIVWTNPIPSAFPDGQNPTNLEVLPGWNTVVVRFDDNTTNESSYWVELWKKVPNNTEYPYAYYYLPAFSGTGNRETVITITTIGKYYLRLYAYHKDGYGFSRFATVSGSSTKTYVSFEIVEGTDESGGSSAGTCFIATAAFGSPYQKEVEILRGFRDKHLLTNRAGRAFVRWYYRHSPRLAEYIRQRKWARALVRASLRPLLWMVSLID